MGLDGIKTLSLGGGGTGGAGQVPIANIEQIPNNTILGNNTGGNFHPIALTAAQVETLIGLNNFGLTKLASTRFADSLQPSFTFSSISGIYSSLKIIIKARSTIAADADSINMTFNGDTAANYRWSAGFFGGSPNSSQDNGASMISIASVSGATSTANSGDQSEVLIVDYADTVFFKTATSAASFLQNNSANWSEVFAGHWLNTAAITDITISVAGGNFVQGSSIALYGIR